jgi:hypothetical protein
VVKGRRRWRRRVPLRRRATASRTDRDGDPTITKTAARARATAGQELTFTAYRRVRRAHRRRSGRRRFRDGDRARAGSDPADPNSIPNGCPNDPTCAKCERASRRKAPSTRRRARRRSRSASSTR